jgi:hypothetical protein
MDLLNFFISLKTLDFFSSVFCFQGLVMITKHVTPRLPQKSLAHLYVHFAESHSNTLPEGLPRRFLMEWQFLIHSFGCAPAVFDPFTSQFAMILTGKKDQYCRAASG